MLWRPFHFSTGEEGGGGSLKTDSPVDIFKGRSIMLERGGGASDFFTIMLFLKKESECVFQNVRQRRARPQRKRSGILRVRPRRSEGHEQKPPLLLIIERNLLSPLFSDACMPSFPVMKNVPPLIIRPPPSSSFSFLHAPFNPATTTTLFPHLFRPLNPVNFLLYMRRQKEEDGQEIGSAPAPNRSYFAFIWARGEGGALLLTREEGRGGGLGWMGAQSSFSAFSPPLCCVPHIHSSSALVR